MNIIFFWPEMVIENKLVICNIYPYQKTGMFPFDWKNEEDGKPILSTHLSPKIKKNKKNKNWRFFSRRFTPTYVQITVTKVLKPWFLVIRASIVQRPISSKPGVNVKPDILTIGSKAFF